MAPEADPPAPGAEFVGLPGPDAERAVASPATAPDPAAARPLNFTVGRLRLAGLEWGPPEAPVVIAVHGLLDHAGVWAPAAERWAAHGLRVVAPDLRGHGASAHLGPESGYAPLDHVQDIVALVETLPTPPRVFVGHSLGALVVAVHGAVTGDDATRVLVEPPLPGGGPPSTADLARWLRARREPPTHPPLADLDAATARLARGMPHVPPDRLRRFAARAVRHRADGLAWRFDPRLRLRTELGGLSAERWLELLGGLRPSPTLIFADDSDRVRPADRTRQVRACPDAHICSTVGGHHLPLSSPGVIADAVLDRLTDG